MQRAEKAAGGMVKELLKHKAKEERDVRKWKGSKIQGKRVENTRTRKRSAIHELCCKHDEHDVTLRRSSDV